MNEAPRFGASPVFFHSRHGSAGGLAHGYARWIKALQAPDIDAEVVRSNTFAMERVDAADFAEKVRCRLGVKSILGERLVAGKKRKLALMDFQHERVLAKAD